jgi:outer membrane protein assembly factor BamB
MNTHESARLIRAALSPSPHVQAPPELGDEIYRVLLETPQKRGGLWPFAPTRAPAMAALWILLIVSILATGILFALGVLQPRPTLPDIVGMYHGGPARTGAMPGPGPVGPVEIAWSVPRTGVIPFNIMPVVADDTVFVGDGNGTLSALDARTGELRWEETIGSSVTASPLYADGVVAAGTQEGAIVALDAATGSEQWRFDAGSRAGASLAASDGVLVAGTDDGILFGLDIATGALQWQITTAGPLTRGPAIADGSLYVGVAGGRFSAIDLATRDVLWAVELGPGELATPAVSDGTVYTATGLATTGVPHELVAMDVADGSRRWTFAAPSKEPLFVSAVDDRMVYAGSEDFSLYALDATTGALRWRFDTGGVVGSLASLVDDVLFIPSADRFVYAVDAATGVEIWRVEVDGEPTIPVVIDGRVIVGTGLGMVTAIVGAEDP